MPDLPGGAIITESRPPCARSPEMDLMKGFQPGIAAKSVSSAQTRAGDASISMLVSMRRSSFALGTVFQQSSIPLAALVGLIGGDRLHAFAWVGLGAVTAGLMALAWPRQAEGPKDWSAALLGLIAGAGFAISSNAFRRAAIVLEPRHLPLAALATVFVVQAMQTGALIGWLALTDRRALRVAVGAGRASLGAGFFGAAASGLWFTAFALSPAGPVRAVGVVEMPIATLAGRRVFAERFASWQWLAAGLAGLGVALAATGCPPFLWEGNDV